VILGDPNLIACAAPPKTIEDPGSLGKPGSSTDMDHDSCVDS